MDNTLPLMKPIKPQLKLICLLNGLLIIHTSTVSHFILTAHKIMLTLFCVPCIYLGTAKLHLVFSEARPLSEKPQLVNVVAM